MSTTNTNAKIKELRGLEVLDSRGNPTIACSVILDNGIVGTAMVPSGASTGDLEALELRDGDPSRYQGKGVQKAIANIQSIISKAVCGMEAANFQAVDDAMLTLDGTENKSNLGANAILAVSMATVTAAAANTNKPLYSFLSTTSNYLMPAPLVNVINGGAHANNSLDFQEFMLVPHRQGSFADNLRMVTEIFHQLKSKLKANKLSTGLGDEGGFAPDLESSNHALDYLIDAIHASGYKPGIDISLALDVAASEFYLRDEKRYYFKKGNKAKLTSDEMIALYKEWLGRYPIVSIEDGLSEHDKDGWITMTADLGGNVQLVGDDLFVTNPKILSQGIESKMGNAVLVKLNQVGTVSETLATIQLAKRSNYKAVISHRSGETEDTFIADLSVATNAGQIKTGSVCRGERTAKYNRLLQIEADLGARVNFNATLR